MKSKAAEPLPVVEESEVKAEEKPKKALTLIEKILAKNKHKKLAV